MMEVFAWTMSFTKFSKAISLKYPNAISLLPIYCLNTDIKEKGLELMNSLVDVHKDV